MNFFVNNWDTILEILILWWVYYMVFMLIKGTVAEQVLKGLIVVSVIVVLTGTLDLVIINWLLTRLLAISVIAFLIIFQPEIRRGLAKLGRIGVFSADSETLEEISKAAVVMSKKKIGALIAIERETGLRKYVESGVGVDATVTSELINTIFTLNSPLHDGGIIVSEQLIEAAACLFPLTQNPNVPKTLGTRHRAAIGLSEEADAVVVVVSEETGTISVATGGRMTRDIEPRDLSAFLSGLFAPRTAKRTFLGSLFKFIGKKQDQG
ncbi:MAG: TIGR00159 family protein [Candidatus Omnitrophica bacterium]|nr:TIGR00159 family protein [Candidatus Omnitrophota bacterium]